MHRRTTVSELEIDEATGCIVESVGRRLEKLALRAMAHISAQDSTAGDVEENIAEEYLPKL